MTNLRFPATSILVVFSLFITAFAQQSERTIKRKTWDNEPLQILDVKVKGTTANFNQVFLEGTDWFNGLTVTVKNNSNKTINYIELGVNFPAPSNTEFPTQDFILYGHDAGLPVEGNEKVSNDPPLQPNGTATLIFGDYTVTRQLLTQNGQPQNISEIELEISEVIFSDDTSWDTGTFNTRDPNNPENWIPTQSSGLLGKTTTCCLYFKCQK